MLLELGAPPKDQAYYTGRRANGKPDPGIQQRAGKVVESVILDNIGYTEADLSTSETSL